MFLGNPIRRLRILGVYDTFSSMKARSVLICGVLLALPAIQACSGPDRLPTGEDALLAAHQQSAKATSYSGRFTTGFGAKTFGEVGDVMEFHRPEVVVSRGPGGEIHSATSGNIAFKLRSTGAWCWHELESGPIRDVLSAVPESFERIVKVERPGGNELVIEGFAFDLDVLTNSEHPAVKLHRLLIDSSGDHVLEWTSWVVPFVSDVELLAMSDDELSALGESTTEGPWNKTEFGDYDSLAPFDMPENVETSCLKTLPAG